MRLLTVALLGCLLAAACGGGEDSSADVAGVYVLDGEQLARDFLRARLERMDGAERAGLTAQDRRALLVEARATAALSDVRLDLMADGSFVVRYRYDGDEGRRRGTWKRSGGALHLRTTHSASGALAQPTEVQARYADGAVSFLAGEEIPHPFTLRRR